MTHSFLQRRAPIMAARPIAHFPTKNPQYPEYRVPSIILQNSRNYTTIVHDLKHLLPKATLEANFQHNFLHTPEKFRISQELTKSYLTKNKHHFHTFALPEEREVKLVLEGVPHSTPCDTIMEELAIVGLHPTSVSFLFAAKKYFVNSFLLKLKKKSNYCPLYDLTLFMHLRVKVRSFEPRPDPAQFFNCQIFEHSSTFSHYPPRFVCCGQ